MWRSGRPSVKWNEVYRLLPALVGLVGTFVLELMTPRGIAVWIGYAFPLWYLSRVSRKPAIFLSFVAFTCTGLIMAGHVLSPPGMNEFYAAVNQTIGVVFLWGCTLLLMRSGTADERLNKARRESAIQRNAVPRNGACDGSAHTTPSNVCFKSLPETRNVMNESTTLPSRKKSPSEAVLGNGKPLRRRAGDVPAKDSLDAHSRLILATIVAFRDGDFSVRLPADWTGIDGQIAEAFNQTIAQEERISKEVTRLSETVGKEGRLKQRMSLPGAVGGWAAKADSINTLIDDLVRPTTEVARTIGAVAKGDLGQSMELEVDGRALKGEFLRSAKLVNTMIEQLSVFTSEVTRVAREVGTEGKLGGQAQVKGVSGVWKELTDSVNQMAGNLTAQVRNIADVTIAVANGDLSKKITVDVRGEILQLKEAINTMVDQLRSFASEVTRVAREVGTDGRLGGQAVVPGVAGTWKDLTDSVNAMATNLTAQVRNIATVTTAVARGDLSRKITVDVKGEILELKETINTMVDQLNGFSSEVTRVAREVGTEGQARRPGRGAGRGRHLEGSHRLGELDGLQPHRPGPQHRRRDHGRREGRSVLEDHRRGEGRNPGAEKHHQHDGRSAQRLRRRSDPRGARGRHRRQARRPGAGARRGRHLEGPHRQRELHGLQPHRPGPQHRRSHHRRGQRRSCPRRSPSTCAARFSS